jgi:probable F420-dependent oxidoreductase
MKFGAFGLSGTFQEIVDECQFAERVGFDGVFFGQHHQAVRIPGRQVFQDRIVGNLLLCAAVAARTERVDIGTAIHILPLSHPIQVAEDTAAIDIISGGRLILGVGIGYQPRDFEAFGIPMAQRVSRFEESLEILRRAWTEDNFSFVGKRFTLRNVSITPKPMQKPHPPLWVGPWSMEGAKRAARQGTGFVSDPIHNTPALQQMVTLYKELATARGVKPYTAVMREILIADSREEAMELYGEAVLGTYRNYWSVKAINPDLEPWVKDMKSQQDVTWDVLTRHDRVLVGSPKEIIGQIERLNDDLGGFEYLLPVFPHPAQRGHERAMAAMKLFGEKVAPHFR